VDTFGNELVKIGCGYGDKGLRRTTTTRLHFQGDEDGDPFATSDDEDEARGDLPSQAVKFLRSRLRWRIRRAWCSRKFLYFWAMGLKMRRWISKLGREAKNALDLLGTNIQMMEYEGLGHCTRRTC